MHQLNVDQEYIESILKRYEAGTASPEEIRFIEYYMDLLESSNTVDFSEEKTASQMENLKRELYKALQERMGKDENNPDNLQSLPIINRNKRIRVIKWMAAALFVLAFGAVYWIFSNPRPKNFVAAMQSDIGPGHDGAILTLSDGSAIILDSAANGIVANQNGTSIMNSAGRLTYRMNRNSTAEAVSMNLLSTPRGRQYQLVLPDGTIARLNAASSIRFPVAFAQHQRKVTITGEVYFEVKHDASRPFQVEVNGNIVEDIGTTFNINAYDDENAVKATLIEGAIKVADHVLDPGQQASIDGKTGEISIKKVDTSSVTAWAHGLLSMNDISVEELMRQLSRWYNVDIRYENGVPKGSVSGLIERNVSLSNILSVLQANGIHAHINGNTIIITD